MKSKGIRLAAMGDAMLDRSVGTHIVQHPERFAMRDIRECIAPDAMVFLNLETPVGTRGIPDAKQHPNVTFRSHPDCLQVLKRIGVSVVSLGNNHMLDYGEAALRDTLEHLDAAGIRHVGAGRNYKEANRPLTMEINGLKIAMLSHVFIYSTSTRMAKKNTAGVSDHRIRKILPRIRELRRAGYIVIVSLHWGNEYSFYPIPYQMQQARRMIDNGAALILGHGPHYPQGIEHHGDGTIVYSLGNFMFDEPHRYANRSFIYQAELDDKGRVRSQHLNPFRIVNGAPVLSEGRQKEVLIKFVHHLGIVYQNKNRAFWRKINNYYFNDVWARAVINRSLRFALLPPWSFYFSVGLKNYISKIKIANLATIFRQLQN
jgi:poly-gamma-glutamate synthesis protein (capsule biosynthesis protein)